MESMPDRTDTSSFSSLPTGLVSDLLATVKPAADAAHAAFDRILARRDGIRDKLGQAGLLGSVAKREESTKAYPFAGIAGTFCSRRMLDTGIVCSAAFSVGGVPENGSAVSADGTGYRLFLESDSVTEDTDAVLSGYKAMLMAELSVQGSGVTLVRGSFASMFAHVMTALPSALKIRETKTGAAFLAKLKDAVIAFDTLASGGVTGARLCLPSSDTGLEFGEIFDMPPFMKQTELLSLILEPGEFAGPAACDCKVLDTVSNLPIKDTSFAALRDRIVTGLKNSTAVYFRPAAWSPALRLEFTPLGDSGRLESLLASFGKQCTTPGFILPVHLQRANGMADSLCKALKTVRDSALSGMLSAGNDNAQGLFTLLRTSDSTMGDINE